MSAIRPENLERALEEQERLTLAQIEAGAPLSVILEDLSLIAEVASGGGMVASILLVDGSGRQLTDGAAPSLPSAYCAAIDGIAIGPGVGSCGIAAHVSHPIYVSDIACDELWANFRELAARHALRACWSTPILDNGNVVGRFAVYHRTPRMPTPEALGAIGLITQAAGTAILKHRLAA